MFKDKLGLGATGKAQPAFVDDDFAGKYPILAQFMCAIVDDDGKTRQTSTVNIFVEMGVVKASLRERDHALTLWVTSGSVEGIFEALEDALNKNPPEWRAQAQDGTTRRVRA